jgi:hypothetical protein
MNATKEGRSAGHGKVGKKFDFYTGTLEIGKPAIIYRDGQYYKTSKVEDWMETSQETVIKTANSIYRHIK